jgi:hypothetical protein
MEIKKESYEAPLVVLSQNEKSTEVKDNAGDLNIFMVDPPCQ